MIGLFKQYMIKNAGTIGLGFILSFTVTILGGVTVFYNMQADTDNKIRDNKELISDLDTKHDTDLVAVNGKLDLLLDNFELKYEPKY